MPETELQTTPEPSTQPTQSATDETIANLTRDHDAAMTELRIASEAKYQLALMGAKNPPLAAKILDLSKVSVNGETITGIEPLIKGLMASDPYLFGQTMPGRAGDESSSGAVHGEVPKDPNTLSDRDYYAMHFHR